MELTWEGDLALMTRRESGKPASFALLRLRPDAAQEEIDEAFQRDVIEVWHHWQGQGRKFTRNPHLLQLTAIYEDMLSGRSASPPHTYHTCRIGRAVKPKSGKLRKLHLLLQSLPWQQRQQTIMAMPESTRRALEGYMLSSRSQKNRTSIPRTRAAHIWRCGAAGFVAAVHLGHGLQAQSAKRQDLASAARHFCVLLRWRAKCQCLHSELKDRAPQTHPGIPSGEEAELFARTVVEAQPRTPKLFLRVRMIVSGQRLSTPLRADVSTVLCDWMQLGCHKGVSIHPGGKSAPSPEEAADRWLHTCNAWVDIWKKRGRAAELLQKQLSNAQKRFRCAFQSSVHRRRRGLTELRSLLREEQKVSDSDGPHSPESLPGLPLQ